MIMETRTYKDYNGITRTENFFFNLSKAELAEMELSTEGGYAEMIERIVSAQDRPALVKIFKELLLKSYGEKSPDGKRFIKSEELSLAFSQTEAFSDMFMELATNSEKAAEFINGVIPEGFSKQSVPSANMND